VACPYFQPGVSFWQVATGQPIPSRLQGATGAATSLAYSPDGGVLALGLDGKPKVWEATTGKPRPLPFEGSDGVRQLAFSPDGRRLATVGKSVRLWDLKTSQQIHSLKHEASTLCAAFHPDGKRLASADGEGTIKLWDARTGRELRTYRGHSDGVTGLAFSTNGKWFATASHDGTVRVWDATQTARDWHGAEARKVVQSRFEKLLFRDKVVASLSDDAALGDEVRPVALELAREWDENPYQIGEAAIKVNCSPDGRVENYAQALRDLEFVCRTVPGNGAFLNALGVSQYRLGRYREALATMEQAVPFLEEQGYSIAGGNPGNLAFRSMAHFRLGQTEEAHRFLRRYREVMTHPPWSHNEYAKSFLREAEALIDGKPAKEMLAK